MARPLDGIQVIEMAGLAPSPYCGMILADFGADVVVVDRLSKGRPEIPNVMERNPFDRGKRSMRVNLKTADGVRIIRRMIEASDVLVEPYRPGVMEALQLSPDDAHAINPGLIYARLTGWGQKGPYANMAGHDIDYIALSGALSLFRRKGERPLPPCNLLGDFAGGGMLCAMGILLALVEKTRSGKGQVVDAAMVDGAASFATLFHGLLAHNLMTPDIGTNVLDGGAPFYQTYETSDGRFMAVGAIEGRFYAELLKGLGIDSSDFPHQFDMAKWPEMIDRMAEIFKTRTRDEWTRIFDGKDACVAPVLDLDEVKQHPHNVKRDLMVILDDISQPAPAPRLSRTPGKATPARGRNGADTRAVLETLGYSADDNKGFFDSEIVE
ncbi:MAG: CaiB/BaiF CoA-transferase family protein [Deltaproteobacteria bacterium]|nr:CaiB/BaiF CoA-transferase family protein [Deltaproteobacteria bacterium]